ncbi:unnamed protein product [Aphanomyces euteiches]
MSVLWVSSFTRQTASTATVSSSGWTHDEETRELKLRMHLLDQIDAFVNIGAIPTEFNALVMVSAVNLRRLGVVSHSLVLVRHQDRIHIAQIQLQTHASDDIVYMSPFLAQNLVCHESEHVSLVPAAPHDIGIDNQDFSRLQVMPAVASRVEIAPIRWNSSVSSPTHQERILEALKLHFSDPRLLQVGDVFGVPVVEAFPENTSPSLSMDPAPVVVNQEVHFFRVEAMDTQIRPIPRALSVIKDDTTLVQSSHVATRLIHERIMKQYTLSTTGVPQSPSTTFQIFPAHVRRLVEWLHPTSLPMSVSIAIGGVAGSGKRTLVYNAAQELGLYVLEVSFTELASTSELQLLENVRQVVKKAQSMAPCILFLNRFFLTEKDNEEAQQRLGSTLMECIRREMRDVPLIVAVEDMNDLPVLIRQSFMYEIMLQAPSEEERLDILRQLTLSTALHPSVQLESIAHRTAGRTVGELKALVADASTHCLEALCTRDSINPSEAFQLTDAHFDAAIRLQETKASLGLGKFSIPNVKWEDVGGLEHVKDEIMDMVQLPLKHPELFASGVRQRSGILLYGPPGTGKTLLAKAIATECNMNFISVKGPELLNMYIGESEKNVRQVFQQVDPPLSDLAVLKYPRRHAMQDHAFSSLMNWIRSPHSVAAAVILVRLERHDFCMPTWNVGGVMDRVVSQLLTEIDSNLNQVFVVGATNRPDLIESALLRPGRFDRLLYLGICQDKPTQLKVVQALTRKFHLAPQVDLKEVVALCPLNFTGADFYALCSIALSLAIKDRVAALDLYIETANREDVYSERPLHAAMVLENMSADDLQVQVSQQHFEAALPHVIPSVAASEIAHYEKLRREFRSLQLGK